MLKADVYSAIKYEDSEALKLFLPVPVHGFSIFNFELKKAKVRVILLHRSSDTKHRQKGGCWNCRWIPLGEILLTFFNYLQEYVAQRFHNKNIFVQLVSTYWLSYSLIQRVKSYSQQYRR